MLKHNDEEICLSSGKSRPYKLQNVSYIFLDKPEFLLKMDDDDDDDEYIMYEMMMRMYYVWGVRQMTGEVTDFPITHHLIGILLAWSWECRDAGC